MANDLLAVKQLAKKPHGKLTANFPPISRITEITSIVACKRHKSPTHFPFYAPISASSAGPPQTPAKPPQTAPNHPDYARLSVDYAQCFQGVCAVCACGLRIPAGNEGTAVVVVPVLIPGDSDMNAELVTADELAQRLRVRSSTVRLWARRGMIPSVKISSKVLRFDPDAVIAALKIRGSNRVGF